MPLISLPITAMWPRLDHLNLPSRPAASLHPWEPYPVMHGSIPHFIAHPLPHLHFVPIVHSCGIVIEGMSSAPSILHSSTTSVACSVLVCLLVGNNNSDGLLKQLDTKFLLTMLEPPAKKEKISTKRNVFLKSFDFIGFIVHPMLLDVWCSCLSCHTLGAILLLVFLLFCCPCFACFCLFCLQLWSQILLLWFELVVHVFVFLLFVFLLLMVLSSGSSFFCYCHGLVALRVGSKQIGEQITFGLSTTLKDVANLKDFDV